MSGLPSQIAFKAADYMAEHGHCKGMLQDVDGRVCLEGAVRMAAFGHLNEVKGSWSLFEGNIAALWEYLYTLLVQDYPGQHLGPVTFNDTAAESGEDVILLLKRAGRELEEQGR